MYLLTDDDLESIINNLEVCFINRDNLQKSDIDNICNESVTTCINNYMDNRGISLSEYKERNERSTVSLVDESYKITDNIIKLIITGITTFTESRRKSYALIEESQSKVHLMHSYLSAIYDTGDEV
tara:strand:- start:1306 stop:1683 length:378 start_codon:yes stop_codon:yes gene_type:complete